MSTAPQGWQTPKTNWQAADIVHPADLNRIEGNIAYLKNEHILAGPESSRPQPGVAGRLYLATGAAQRIWRDTGSAWELAAGVPKGVIQMWSGSLASIPQGWTLCNGGTVTAADGTQMSVPDLRDRFVVGAGLSYYVGERGGAAQVRLTVAELPPHTHSGTTDIAGDHTHEVQVPYGDMNSGLGGARSPISSTRAVTTSSAGAHQHTFTTQATGGGQPHENRPPYYALAYIMKL